jgi:hypothetical protein
MAPQESLTLLVSGTFRIRLVSVSYPVLITITFRSARRLYKVPRRPLNPRSGQPRQVAQNPKRLEFLKEKVQSKGEVLSVLMAETRGVKKSWGALTKNREGCQP